MKIIKPPNTITRDHRTNKLIFLAGSIEKGKADNWQSKVEKYFARLEDYVILNPIREEWDSSWKEELDNPHFYKQVNWELDGLERADKIIMCLLPSSQSPISLLELGLSARSGKLLVCCEKGFWKKGNIDVVCERYKIPIYEDLDELLQMNF